MAASGPFIEELPDDYEEAQPPLASATSAASSSSGGKVVQPRPSAADSGAAGLKKGFFDRPSARPKSRAVVTAASEAALDEPAPPAAACTSSAALAASSSEGGCEGKIAALLEGLRAQLSTAGASAGDGQSQPGVMEALDGLREALVSPALPASRWPTPQARSGLSKSSLEANTALAEMRSASNDARRMRSGEEKKAMSELRRGTDDVLERVKKVVELSAPVAVAEEDKTPGAVAAFHALPFTTKLRLVADDRVALSLIAGSFVTGMALVLGILVEVYSAWGCGYRCGLA